MSNENEMSYGQNHLDVTVRKFSAFVLTFLIMDLVFCFIRLLAGGATMVVELHPSIAGIAKTEAILALGVGLVGILANILLLIKAKTGILLARLNCFLTAGNIIAAVILTTKMQQGVAPPAGMNSQAYAAGQMIGLVLVLLIRFGLLTCYWIAVGKAQKALDGTSQAE